MAWDDGNYYDVSFGIHKSRRYHAKLRDFYNGVYNVTTGLNAFSSSAAFVAILGDQNKIAASFAAVVALASLFDSIFKYQEMARTHHILCARFTELAAEMAAHNETEKNLRKICNKRLLIEKDEPNEKRLIELVASNEEARSRGVGEDQLYHLTFLQRTLGYVFTFGMNRLSRQRARRQGSGGKVWWSRGIFRIWVFGSLVELALTGYLLWIGKISSVEQFIIAGLMPPVFVFVVGWLCWWIGRGFDVRA